MVISKPDYEAYSAFLLHLISSFLEGITEVLASLVAVTGVLGFSGAHLGFVVPSSDDDALVADDDAASGVVTRLEVADLLVSFPSDADVLVFVKSESGLG